MGADYSFELISIIHWVPQFIGHNKIFLGSVFPALDIYYRTFIFVTFSRCWIQFPVKYLFDVFWKSIPECAELFMNFNNFFIFLQYHKKYAELFKPLHKQWEFNWGILVRNCWCTKIFDTKNWLLWVKFRFFEEATNIWKKYLLLSKWQNKWEIFSNFVAFLKYLNFTHL